MDAPFKDRWPVSQDDNRKALLYVFFAIGFSIALLGGVIWLWTL